MRSSGGNRQSCLSQWLYGAIYGFERIEFDVLVALAEADKALAPSTLARRGRCSQSRVNTVLKGLENSGYVHDGRITKEGIAALEPYRAKRAIFIAAGFGSRMVPITLNTPKPLVRVHGQRIIDGLIDACLLAGIEEIYVVRGYLAEQFDQLQYKYPMIRFIENPMYNEANNISSSMLARYFLSNAYVFEADLLISNPRIVTRYHYTSDFLAIPTKRTDDWCFRVEDGIIQEERVAGAGDDIWQMVGISYWNNEDGHKLVNDIKETFEQPGGKERYWEQVPLVYCKDHYRVAVRECKAEDIIVLTS